VVDQKWQSRYNKQLNIQGPSMVKTKKHHSAIKSLNPKSADVKYTGLEPEWRLVLTDGDRTTAMLRAFAWYNYHYSKREAKDMIAHWLEHHDRARDAKLLRGIPDSQIRSTTAWVCRMNLVGLDLSEHELSVIDSEISDMLRSKQEVVKTASAEETAQARMTIQDHLRERMSECAGELEGMFDEFMKQGARMSADFKPIAQIRGMNVAPQMIGTIATIWRQRLAEFEQTVEGRDADLVEAYGHLSKIQLRNCIKFCETVINDCASYVQIKKVERKPRAKKAVSPEKLSSRFKYLREFPELNLTSASPASLVNAAEAWLYDTKKRKLIHVMADTHIGTFTVKGSSIVAFDTANSSQKTLRRPAEQIQSMMSVGKPAARRVYKDIKSTEIRFNGRGNEHLIILRAW
jgi:hypothetical protein